MENSWILRRDSWSELTDSTGQRREIPYRAVFDLLDLLAKNRKSGLSRAFLAEQLWPDKDSSKQRDSLRQCLSHLRKLIGPDQLETSRELCRLVESMSVTVTGDCPEAYALGRIRSRESSLVSELPDPTTSFFNFTNYLLNVDPEKGILAMRDNLSFVHGLSGDQFRQLVSRLPRNSKFRGWRDHFVGYDLVGNSDIFQAMPYLTNALEQGQITHDPELLVQTCTQLVIAHSRLGKLEKALSYAKRGLATAQASRSKPLMANAYQSMACVYVHMGKPDEADAHYQQAISRYTNLVDSCLIDSVRTYHTSVLRGRPVGDSLRVESARARVTSGNSMLSWFESAIEANDLSLNVHPHDALPPLMAIVDSADRTEVYYSILAREALVRACQRAKEFEEAARVRRKLASLRTGLGLRLCPWDLIARSS